MLDVSKAPGAYTEAEIQSTPRCWKENLRALEGNGEVERVVGKFSSQRKWLFVGCGSSYYLALAAAASWTALTGLAARAIPASELLLFPNLTLNGSSAWQPVLISRSGHTSEILQAAGRFNSEGVATIAFTCSQGQPLEDLCAATVYLPAADEQSTVMTRSFTSMLLGLQFLAAKLAGNTAFLDSLGRLSSFVQTSLNSISSRVQAFVESRDFADYVCLGQGPYYGLACEGALKVQEMSCSYSQAFHTLEFRHGPKAITGPETLIVFLLSASGLEAEREVLEEVKSLGGTTLVVANEVDERTRRNSDLLIHLDLAGDEYSRLAAYIIPGQLLGLYTGLKKGLDPDRPRHLSRAVILPEGS
ncbi:MAG: SIS domain-containing protein [Terriglobia bacterium]